MQTKHGGAFTQFNTTFPPAIVDKWEKMVAEWDADKSKKKPYEEPLVGELHICCYSCRLSTIYVGTTMTEVQLELANKENADAARGNESSHDISAGKWLSIGLDIEEQQ
jgi:hypothetical protein